MTTNEQQLIIQMAEAGLQIADILEILNAKIEAIYAYLQVVERLAYDRPPGTAPHGFVLVRDPDTNGSIL